MDSLLSWYQMKIGAYDLQIWERAVELREQQDVGIKSMDKRSSSVKPELIDIDLVRGSTFSKNKPQYSWLVVSSQALIRVLMLPIFARWWIQQTSKAVTFLFIFLYILQVAAVLMYANAGEKEFENVSLVEIISPCAVMLLVGSIHCHVVSTNFKLNSRPDSRRAKKKRTLSSALLEPVAGQSQYSSLNLVTSSLNKHAKSTEDSTHPDENAPLLDCGECVSRDKLTPEKTPSDDFASTKHPVEEIKTKVHEKRPPANKKRKSSSSTTSSENDAFIGELNADSTSTDTNGKKRSRHDSLYEELNSTSSGCNSTTGSTESDASSSHESTGKGKDEPAKSTRAKHFSATVLLPCASHGGERIGVRIWESNQCKKIQASLLDIGSIIRRKVQRAYLPHDMLFIGMLLAGLVSIVPGLHRAIYHHSTNVTYNDTSGCSETFVYYLLNVPRLAYGESANLKTIFLVNVIVLERFVMSFSFFFMLSAAHQTFRQRLLFAKYFGHLTSSRRAKKSDIPHFRLDKVENVRIWLSLRSYLRRRGPQRSIDVIVSSAFFLSLTLLCFISIQLLHDSEVYFTSLLCWEMTIWLLAIAVFLLNFMTLGVQINKKYRNTSVLLTEQINLYLQMKQKPSKKDELQRVNSVLTIAGKLIKEIERPFNIYGLAMNPLLYNISRVVVLSAFSGVISEMLGFKLKIWKIKP